MEEIKVQGGKKLVGTVKIEGAKNAVLPILAASLLAEEGVTILHNVPVLSDVLNMINILKCLNVRVVFDRESNQLKVDATEPLNDKASYECMSKMRASILIMGSLLTRNGRTKVSLPGGCKIGKRPIDLHLKGFEKLGAEIKETNEEVEATATTLTGNTITFDFVSVGATQNILLAAVKAKGTTVIENAAQEPEVIDLVCFLNKMGAKIYVKNNSIEVEGVEKLFGVEYRIMQDRIEAGTFMIAAAITMGNILVQDAVYEHNKPLILKLKESGAIVRKEKEGIRVIGRKVTAVNIKTAPYPGFPTDLQAVMTAMLACAAGNSVVEETVFENRFQHLKEMQYMNCRVRIDENKAIIFGGQDIKGALVAATDLRAAAGLILLGLIARGVTRIHNLKHLDRGYFKFHEKLQKLGALINRDKIDAQVTPLVFQASIGYGNCFPSCGPHACLLP